MSTQLATAQQIARANQAYRTYLDVLYEIDYYHRKHQNLAKRSRHIDFTIALGTAASGGSGLGILAEPSFAWLCGGITTVSTIGALAKGAYDWNGRLQKSLEMVEFYTPICATLRNLVEDIQAARQWSADSEQRYKQIRQRLGTAAADPTEKLPTSEQREIQNAIKTRIPYKKWWEWRD